MVFRIISVWVAVTAAIIVSFFAKCASISFEYLLGPTPVDVPLPLLTGWFLSLPIYWFPLPLFLWAAAFTVFFGRDADHATLIRTCCFSAIAVFLALFSFAIIIPWERFCVF